MKIMNNNVMPSIVQIEAEKLRNLVNEVKETVATNINTQPRIINQKKFGIVDLWNCQKMMKTATSHRRNSTNLN
jgi:ADP-dependent phosphofructokinase/glucokinase